MRPEHFTCPTCSGPKRASARECARCSPLARAVRLRHSMGYSARRIAFDLATSTGTVRHILRAITTERRKGAA